MKRSTTIAATVLGLSLALASEAIAVPVTTSFTARIQDGNGPVDGLINLNFKIFDAATAGTMVWEEMHTGVSADAGLVYVALGSVAPTTNGLDETVFTGGGLFLEVTVNGDVQSPRVPILSVPYAIHAATADTLGSLAPGDVALSTHNHNSAYAAISHNHDSAYAALNHNHDAAYAAINHDHDTRYYTQASLNTAGTINVGTNPVDWTKLKGVPAGFADGVDSDSGGDITSVTAGDGLSGGSTAGAVSLAVDTSVQRRTAASPLTCPSGFLRTVAQNGAATCVAYAGDGAADTVARSDHSHPRGCRTVTNTGTGTASAVCVAGEIVLGGGCNNTSNTGGFSKFYPVNFTLCFPLPCTPPPRYYYCLASSSTNNVTATAVCCSGTVEP